MKDREFMKEKSRAWARGERNNEIRGKALREATYLPLGDNGCAAVFVYPAVTGCGVIEDLECFRETSLGDWFYRKNGHPVGEKVQIAILGEIRRRAFEDEFGDKIQEAARELVVSNLSRILRQLGDD